MSSKRKANWIAPSFDVLTVSDDSLSKRKTKKKTKIDLTKDTGEQEDDTNSMPWVDKYKPNTEEDLAVHKKKIQEVKSWFEQPHNTQATGGRILLLTGPAGCGKTALVDVLKNEIEFELKEWINPLMQEFDRENLRDATARQDSQSQLFHDFILRANRYNQLKVSSEIPTNQQSRVILVEDMPNFLLYEPLKIHNILRQYNNNGKCPLVFIMSESNTDNYVHSLFPKKLQSEFRITNISFNPVAQTGLTKAMVKIATAESKESSDIEIPSKDVFDLLATSSNGDIRSCINSLQFYCTNRNPAQDGTKTKKRKTTRSKKDDTNAKKIAGCIGDKDASLFLFRALGKILYSKRDKEREDVEETLPIHLKHEMRRKLTENPEDVFEHTQVTSDNFLLYLHQNYMEFFGSIDDLVTASCYCGEADVMSGVWDNRHIMNDYTASLSMRGIMFSNTRPSSSTGGTSGGWRPLHKPQWFETSKNGNSRERSGREYFKGCRYAKETLFTEIIPHLRNIQQNNNAVIQDIATFPLNRQQQQRHGQSLKNNELNKLETETMDTYLKLPTAMGSCEEYHQNIDEIDDEIEDFDDD